jgi:integrase
MPISIKQITVKERGVQYQTWLVSGMVNGSRVRIKCKDEQTAKLKKVEQETLAINSERSTRFLATRLTPEQLGEAESCWDRLSPRYTLAAAVDYFLRHHHAPDFTLTVSDSLTRFLSAMEGQIRSRSLEQVKSSVSAFQRFADDPLVSDITTELVERYLGSLRARDGVNRAAPKTWNNERAFLHQFLEWCRSRPQRYIELNPVADVRRFTIEQHHVQVLSIDRCREVMDYVAGYREGRWVPFFAIALFAGIRPSGELRKLADHPEAVDLENKVIKISGAMSKTGKSRQVKIRPNLLKWLRAYPGPILPSKAKREQTAIRQHLKLSHDVLRHTFISCHVGAFNSFADAAIEAGNSEKVIRESYLNTSTFSAARQFWKLEPPVN